MIFATYQNAGVRVFDMSDRIRAARKSAAWCRRSRQRSPTRGPNRARVIQSADVFVDAGGLIYATDYNAGLYILEFNGA